MALLEKLQQILTEKNTKITPENIKAGVKIFNIDGALNIPIKMYNTRTEMLQDLEEPEHEYGIVYGDKTESIHEGSIIDRVTMKRNVELSEAVTESADWYTYHGMDYDINFSISPTYAYFSIRENMMNELVDAQYTSTDGIHYTLNGADNQFDLGHNFTLESTYTNWLPVMEDFILSGGKFFEGMYEYVTETDEEYFDVITGLSIENDVLISQNEEKYLPTLWALVKEIYEEHGNHQLWFIIVKENNHYYMYSVTNFEYAFGLISDASNPFHNFHVAYTLFEKSQENKVCERYELDLENETYNLEYIPLTFLKEYNASADYYSHPIDVQEIICWGLDTTLRSDYNINAVTGVNIGSSKNITMGHVPFLGWHHVKTEFNLEYPFQLLPGVNALGKHGDLIGDGSIYNHINVDELLPNFAFINNKFFMSPENLDGKNIVSNDYYQNLNLFDQHTGLCEKKYIIDMSNQQYSPIVTRYCKDYTLILCDDDVLRIYKDKELFTTITLSTNLDYTNSGLSLIPNIINNTLCFVIFYKSNTTPATSGNLIMGYLNLESLEPTVYYNTNVVAYYSYWDRYSDSNFVHVYFDGTNLYTLLPNYGTNYIIYENAQPKVTVSCTSLPSYVCTKDGIFIIRDGYSSTSYDYYKYGTSEIIQNTISELSGQSHRIAVGVDQNGNALLLAYMWGSSNKKFYIYDTPNTNGVMTNKIFNNNTYDQTSTYYGKFYMIRQNNSALIMLYYSEGYLSNVKLLNLNDNTYNNKDKPGLKLEYDESKLHYLADEIYLETMDNNIVSFIIYRPDLTISNDTKNLIDISRARSAVDKLYMMSYVGPILEPQQYNVAEGITDNILYGLTELENENQGGE